ncbi:DUF2264 domain-containing protein [Mangrovibacterium marinum]|uniref:DUF2264 domain-containing protein n=1 Tax=Mangrovibacterium marinum TaxID=1639118 RepID=UPI002A188BFF|nr:DUF2264 domain-containing protein [Mangrovibacterium marinum]
MQTPIKPFITLLLLITGWLTAQASAPAAADKNDKTNVFQLVDPDFKTSPYTGMTRQHWVDAARYLLEGAFSYVHQLDDPMQFPKQPGKSYPRNEGQVPTEKLEGLCRTLFVAAPLLREDPSLTINNIRVADYYRHQLENLLDPQNPSFIRHRAPNGGPSQILVEFGALAISLFVAPDIIWEPLPQAQKDRLAELMLSYGDGPTVDSNWKFFNIFVLSFFKNQGYAVNDSLLEEYLRKSLLDYRGQGWYNDHPAYDYYSMWAYQLYGIIWSEVFGKKYYPDYAEALTQNFKEMNQSYPYLFARDGKMVMWGRSISYRMGAIAPFAFWGMLDESQANLGWLRHISSSTILQFVQHPDFLKDGVPTLGFYGPFEPAVQIYSCRGSVYWMGKAFLGLLVPKDNPFWTAVENEGPWGTEMKEGQVYNHFSPATNLLITNYPNIGASEIRSWCHEKVADDWQKFRSTENYNRLSYNSAFPWQADGNNGEVAMNYRLKNHDGQWEALRLFTFKKFDNEIYYRDAVLETNEQVQLQLAEKPLPNGILRVDRNQSSESIAMRLGHYALPKLHGQLTTTTRKKASFEATIIDNGEYQLAMVPLHGWQQAEVVETEGLHPQAEHSSVINLSANFDPANNESGIYACLMLWKKSGEKWTNDELFPVKSITCDPHGKQAVLTFKKSKPVVVNF